MAPTWTALRDSGSQSVLSVSQDPGAALASLERLCAQFRGVT